MSHIYLNFSSIYSDFYVHGTFPLSDPAVTKKTWDQPPLNQAETCETHISTTSDTLHRSCKSLHRLAYQSSPDVPKKTHPDEMQELRLELARQEVREQTARAQEAEYRMEAAREAVRSAKAKADLAELEFTQKFRLIQSEPM